MRFKPMKRIFSAVLYLFLLVNFTYAQDTPGTVKYPTALDSAASLFEVKDRARSTLAASISSSATSLTIQSADAALFPNSGAVTIDNREVAFYTSKSGGTLSGLIRAREGTAAVTHAAGVSVEIRIIAGQHNALSLSIRKIQQKIGIGDFNPGADKILIGVSSETRWLDHTLDRVKDVVITTPANDQVLAFDSGTGNWINKTLSPAAHNHAAADITSGIFAPARLGSGTPDNTKFLLGDGSWSAISDALVPDTITVSNYQLLAGKNAASGYAGLTAGTKLTTSQGQEVWGIADLTDFGSKSGTGTTAIGATITSPQTNDVLTWDGAKWINQAASGGGGGDAITINTTAAADANFNDSLPAAPSNGINVRFQINTGTSPDNVSAHLLTTDIGSTTFGGGSGFSWTFNAGATDPAIAFDSDSVDITTGTLKQGGTAVVLQSRTISTTGPLGGGGGLTGDLNLTCSTCLTGSAPTTNGVLIGQSTQGVAVAAPGSANQVFRVPSGGGAPGFGSIDLASSAAVGTSILGGGNGGTGNAFTAFSGASGSLKTYNLPNVSTTILTTNSVVTVPQGGIGVGTLTGIAKGNGTSAFTAAVAGTDYFSPGNISLSVETAGNSIRVPVPLWIEAGGYNGSVAGPNWDLPAANAPTVNVITGTNTIEVVLDFADGGTDLTAQRTIMLPADWTSVGGVDALFKWKSPTTSGNVILGISTSCVADGETNDPSFNSYSEVTDATKGTANQTNDASITGVTITGCAAGELMHLRIARRLSQAGDTMAGTLRLLGVKLIPRRDL